MKFTLCIVLILIQHTISTTSTKSEDSKTIVSTESTENSVIDPCLICFEDLNDDTLLKSCMNQHKYHYNCIKIWSENQGPNRETPCPLCRVHVEMDTTLDRIHEKLNELKLKYKSVLEFQKEVERKYINKEIPKSQAKTMIQEKIPDLNTCQDEISDIAKLIVKYRSQENKKKISTYIRTGKFNSRSDIFEVELSNLNKEHNRLDKSIFHLKKRFENGQFETSNYE